MKVKLELHLETTMQPAAAVRVARPGESTREGEKGRKKGRDGKKTAARARASAAQTGGTATRAGRGISLYRAERGQIKEGEDVSAFER